MPNTTFTPAEFTAFAADIYVGVELAKAHGYTNGGLLGAGIQHRHAGGASEDYEITIDQADDKATITTNLAAATVPTALTAVTPSQTTTADGIDTTTYDLDGEPNTVVNLAFVGSIPIDKITLTLDGTGDGNFVVGPFATGTCTSADGIKISCIYEDRIADGVVCTVKVV